MDSRTGGSLEEFPAELVVRYQTPLGVMDSLEEATRVCESNDLLPELCIQPVVVAEAVDRPGVYAVLDWKIPSEPA